MGGGEGGLPPKHKSISKSEHQNSHQSNEREGRDCCHRVMLAAHVKVRRAAPHRRGICQRGKHGLGDVGEELECSQGPKNSHGGQEPAWEGLLHLQEMAFALVAGVGDIQNAVDAQGQGQDDPQRPFERIVHARQKQMMAT